MESFWILKLFEIISSYQYLQIQPVYKTFLVCKATSQQLLHWKNMRKSWSHVFGQKRVMTAFTARWSLCYINNILKNIQSLYLENDRQIIL